MRVKHNKPSWIRTIPEIINEMGTAEGADQILKYENIFVCTYTASLLYLVAVASLIVRFFIERQNWGNYLTDSIILLLAGVIFSVLASKNPSGKRMYQNSVLTAAVFVFITVRFYYLIGPAVWTLIFIRGLLYIFWGSRFKTYTLGLAIIISGFYITSRSVIVEPYHISVLFYISMVVFIIILAVIAAAIHKVIDDRRYRIETELQIMLKQKEEIAASEEKLRESLDHLQKNQEQMIQQEKLAGIGQLAAGVAHEINNPLGYICSNVETSMSYYHQLMEAKKSLEEYICQMPADKLEKNAELLSKLKEINEKENINFLCADMDEIYHDIDEGLARIREIVQGMKIYVRSEQNNDFADFDLNQNIKNTLLMVRNEVKHDARVVELLGDIPIIQAKGSHIIQVMVNIIINAVQAIKAKETDDFGTIIISTELSKDIVICQIEDNGIGISKENLNQIFNPFFSTKPKNQGTGLGLSIAYDIIVNEHGGELLVKSEEHVGSTFIIRLPVVR